MMKRLAGLILLLSTLFVLPTCGMNSNQGSAGGETGSLAFQLSWNHTTSTNVQPAPPAGADICTYYNITAINASVTDSSGQTVATISPPCSDHGGTISNVPAGTVSVTVAGLVGGAVSWSGQATGVNVVVGQIASAGTVTMNYVGSDTTAPTASSPTPANNATSVAVNTTLSAVFSEDVASPSVNANTFTLTCGTLISGTVTYDSPTRKATFTPAAPLPASSTCSATITTGVEDLAGIQMAANYQWSFTTSAAPPTTGTWDVSKWDNALWGP